MDSALNTPFSDWGNILFNTTIATAIADRLVENSEHSCPKQVLAV
jgi:DNA replication protein DnaC